MEINEKKKRSKSKKPYSSRTYTTGDPQYNMDKFNEIAGTGSVNHVKNFGSDGSYMNGTISPGSSGGSDGASSGGEGGGMGEALVKEETHNKYAMPEGDRIKAFNNALKYAKKYNAPFCYGYDDKRFGLKFFAFEQPFKWNFDDAGFRKKYKATGNIYVAYPDQRPRKENFEGNKNMKNLTEQKIFVSKAKEYIDIPDWINLVPVQDVSKFISNLAPEQVFKVGYVTPIYFYKKLLDKFTLVKLTEMMGYTGVDYRDAAINDKSADEVKDRLDRAANQISNPTGKTDYGTGYNKENDRVKSHVSGMRKDYADTNKVVAQGDHTIYEVDPKTGRKILDADKKPIVKEVVKDLRTILFYPTKNSVPKVNYYLDLKDGKGFFKVDRDILVNTIYQKVLDIINRDTYNGTISNWEDMTDDEQRFLHDIMGKAQAVIDNDAKTASGIALSQGDKIEKNALSATDSVKPDVRALYTGQIYMLDDGKSEFLGRPLVEGLKLKEAKRYVRRYYIKPQNIFCSNKAEILKTLIDIDNSSHQNCTIYTLNNLGDVKDVNKLQNSDVIYYYDDGVLFDKNKVKVMDYDLYIKHEENRDEINPNQVSDKTFNDVYDDRMTDNTVVEEILINKSSLKEDLEADQIKVIDEILAGKRYPKKGDRFKTDKGIIDVVDVNIKKNPNAVEGQDIEDIAVKVNKTSADGTQVLAKDRWLRAYSESDPFFELLRQIKTVLNDQNYAKNKNKNESLNEGYPYMTTNGYKIYNASEYAVNRPYIIARWVENGGDVELWFYGAYDSLDRAQAAKDELSNGVLIYAKDSKFFNEAIDNEFDLDFDDVNAYGEKLREGQEVDGDCCICGEPISGYGNNAEPYAHGRCCDACNLHFVIPARIAQMNNEK